MSTPGDEWNNKDEAYNKRRDGFHSKLFQFHRDNNNPVKRFPLLGGRELDLYHLYLKVKSLGGSKRITQDRLWGDVARSFNLPASVTSASYACRQNFIKYLEPYERYEAGEPALFPSPDPAPRRLTFQTTPTIQTTPPIPHSNHNLLAAKFSHLTQVPGFANLLKQVEKSPELISQIASLPSLLQLPPNQLQLIQLLLQQMAAVHSGKGGSGGVVGATRGGGKKCDWLVRSLECGLPNEVDLSINCLLILSYESGRDWLQVEEVPHLLAVLLAHVGVFSSDEISLESLYVEWYSNCQVDFMAFWQEVVPEWVYLIALSNHVKDTVNEMSFFPQRAVLTHDAIESFRATQVSLIIRNLSFNNQNAQYFAKCDCTLRFLLLCMNSSLPEIKSYSLDALSSIAPYLVIEADDFDSVTYSLLTSVYSCIMSYDRNSVLRGMEILGGLTVSVYNEMILTEAIHSDVLRRILQLSLLSDYQLVQSCLETLYGLSLCGRRLSESILQCEACIKVLMSFLTLSVEDKSLDGLVVVHPDGKEESAVSTNQIPPQETLSSLINSTTKNRLVGQTTPFGNAPVQTTPLSKNSNSANAVPSSKGGLFAANAVSVPTRQQPVAGKGGERKAGGHIESKILFAIQWLQSEYVLSQEEFIPKLDIYSKYLSHCAQLKYTTAATQQEFELIFKKVFPTAVVASIKIGGKDIELIGGIGVSKKRKSPSSSTNTPSPPPPPPIPFTVNTNTVSTSNTLPMDNDKLQKLATMSQLTTTALLASGLLGQQQATSVPSSSQLLVQQQTTSVPSSSQLLVQQQTTSVPSSSQLLVQKQATSVPSSSQLLLQQATSVPSSQLLVQQQATSVPSSSQLLLQQATSVPSSQLLVQQQATSVPSSSQLLLQQQATSVPSSSQLLLQQQATSVPSSSQLLVQQQATSVPSSSQLLVQQQTTSVPSSSQLLVQQQTTSVPSSSQLLVQQQTTSVPSSSQLLVQQQTTSVPSSSQLLVQQQTTSVPSSSQLLVQQQATSVPSSSQLLIQQQATSVPSSSQLLVQQQATSVPSSSQLLVQQQATSVPSSSQLLVQQQTTSVPSQSQQSSSSSSLSRSPSPSLSPLQQLIQATRTQTTNAKTIPKPSPLIQFKKVPTGTGKGGKKKTHQVNGTPLSVTSTPLMPKSLNAEAIIPSPLMTTGIRATVLPNDTGLGMTMVTNDSGKITSLDDVILTRDIVFEEGGGRDGKVIRHTLNGLNSNGVEALKKRERLNETHLTNTNPIKRLKTDVTVENNKILSFISSQLPMESSPASPTNGVRLGSPQRSSQRSVSPAATSDRGSASPTHFSSSLSSNPLVPKPVSVTGLTSLVSRDSSRSVEHSPGPSSSCLSTPPPPDCVKCTCLWENCLLRCTTQRELFSHVYYSHLTELSSFPVSCLWSGCTSKSKRMRPSLLRHVQTHHCSADPVPAPLSVTDTLIKLKLVSPLQPEYESCFTRCLRLTAALVLRNLLDKVPEARRHVRPYERLLTQIAFSENEASHVTAHCLHLLYSSPLPPSSPLSPSSLTFS